MAEPTVKSQPGRHWGRRIVMGLLAVLGLLIFLATGLLIWIGSGAGREFVETRVENINVRDQRADIEGLNGSVLGTFSIDRLSLSDADGVWATADDINVNWSPRALLSRTLSVDEIAVADINILRRPNLGAPTEGELPVDSIQLGEINLPQIRLAEPVIGRTLSASLSGQGRHSPDGGRAALDLQTDQGDSADLNLSWSPEFVLRGDADIDGPAGGLISSLLRLEPDQAISASVETAAQNTDVSVDIAGRRAVQATIIEEDDRVTVSGSVSPDAHPLGVQAQTLLGGTAAIEAAWPLSRDEGLSVQIDAPKLDLAASGLRQRDQLRFDRVELTVRNPLQGLIETDVSIQNITATGEAVFGEVVSFDGRLIATDLAAGSRAVDRLAGPISLSWAEQVLQIDTNLDGQSSGDMAALSGAKLDLAGRFDLSGRTADIDRANIALPGFEFTSTGNLGFGAVMGGELTGRYRILTDTFHDGPSARLTGQASVNLQDKQTRIRLDGNADQFADVPDSVSPLLDERVDYRAQLSIRDGNIAARSFRVSNDQITLTGDGQYRDEQLTANARFDIPSLDDPRFKIEDLSGAAQVNGPIDRLTFTVDSGWDTLSASQITLTDGEAQADGTYGNGVVQADAGVSAQSPDGPITATGQLAYNDGSWSITDLVADIAGLSVEGTANGQGGDLTALTADLSVSGQYPPLPAEQIEAEIALSNARVEASGSIADIQTEQLEAVTVYFEASGPRDAISFDINGAGTMLVQDFSRALEVTARGQADLSEQGPSVSSIFAGELGRQSVSGTVNAAQTDRGWDADIQVDALGGTISGSIQPKDGMPTQVTFALDGIENSEWLLLIGRPVAEGTLNGQGAFTLLNDRIDGDASLSIIDLRSPGSDGDPVGFDITLSLQGEQLDLAMVAADEALTGQVGISGTVDTQPSAPFLNWPPATPLSGTADLRGDIGPVAELFLPPLTNVSGQLNTDLRFTVPPNVEAYDGQLSITDGIFEQGTIGLNLIDIDVRANLNARQLSVSNFTAQGRSGGTVDGEGNISLETGLGSVDLTALDLRVFNRREGYARVGGNLEFSRASDRIRLAGNLDVEDAEFDISKLPKPGLPTLEVRFNDPDLEEEPAPQTRTTTEIDLTVRSSGPINVTGRGLDALMSLNATVTGSFDDPNVSGTATIDRGRFSLLGKRFMFRESTVTIVDEIMQSRLDMEAVRETTDFTALVTLSGTVERPEIELTAEPSLPEDEVLSRILFGRSPTQLTALETARLGAALAQLSGGSGFDVLGSLENAVGLDTLDIGQTTGGQTQLTTGKYLSDDVYLEVRSTAEATPGVAVEWQARPNISVEAETVPGESQGVSIQWKKDFD